MKYLTSLKNKGFRMTKTRKAILFLFDQNSVPLSGVDIIALLKQGNQDVNKSTVYREISFLLDQGIIQEVMISPKCMYYELANNDPLPYAVCSTCNRLEHVKIKKGPRLISNAQKHSSFHIDDYSLVFFGQCALCK